MNKITLYAQLDRTDLIPIKFLLLSLHIISISFQETSKHVNRRKNLMRNKKIRKILISRNSCKIQHVTYPLNVK